jgi:hypothetical protein
MQGDVEVGPIGLGGLLWRLAKTLASVAGILALLSLIPLDVPFVPLFPIVVMAVVVLAFLALMFRFYRQGRRETIVHIVLSLVLLSALQFAMMARDAQRAAALEQRQILAPSRPHRLVVFDWTRQSCFDQCIELLAKTDYRPAGNLPDTAEWAVFEAARGVACYAVGQRKSHLQFLEAGFSDRCAVREIRPAGDSALMIRMYYSSGWFGSRRAMPRYVPRSFDGWVYEIYERSDGSERLLGRWLNGHIRPVSYWFAVVGLNGWKVGERFRPAQFYSAALNAPIVGGRFPGDSTLPPLFDQLAPYLADPKLGAKARRAFGALAVMNNKGDLDTVTRWATDMLASTHKDHVLAGLELLAALPKNDLRRFDPRLVQLLHHEDHDIVILAMMIARKSSQELQSAALPALVARAKIVPVDQLDDYVYLLQRLAESKAHASALSEILIARIAEARSASPPDPDRVRKLEWVLEDL